MWVRGSQASGRRKERLAEQATPPPPAMGHPSTCAPVARRFPALASTRENPMASCWQGDASCFALWSSPLGTVSRVCGLHVCVF